MRPLSACRISCISNTAGRVSISTVTFMVPIGRPSRTSAKAMTSSHSAASWCDCSLGRYQNGPLPFAASALALWKA